MSAITILLVAIVALLAGMEGILDEFQFCLLYTSDAADEL